MTRVIWVYRRGKAGFSFLPGKPDDVPVFGAITNQVGLRIFADRVLIPRAGEESLTPRGLILATRCGGFHLRRYRDWLFPNRPPATTGRARTSRRPAERSSPRDGGTAVRGRKRAAAGVLAGSGVGS